MQRLQCSISNGTQKKTFFLIINVEEIVVFLGLKLFHSDNAFCIPAVEMRKSLL